MDPYGGNGYAGAGGPGAAPPRSTTGFRGTPENAKTRMCNRWLSGDCRFGDKCNFAHGEHELRSYSSRGGQSQPGYAGQQGGYAPQQGAGPGARGPGGYSASYGGGGGYGGGGYGSGGPAGMGGGYGMNGGPPMQQHAGSYGHNSMMQQHPQQHQPQQQQQQQQQQELWPAPVEGPGGWLMYRDQDTREPYYHHPASGATTWERPPEWR